MRFEDDVVAPYSKIELYPRGVPGVPSPQAQNTTTSFPHHWYDRCNNPKPPPQPTTPIISPLPTPTDHPNPVVDISINSKSSTPHPQSCTASQHVLLLRLQCSSPRRRIGHGVFALSWFHTMFSGL